MSESRSALFSRAAFCGVVAAVAAPLALGPEASAEAATRARSTRTSNRWRPISPPTNTEPGSPTVMQPFWSAPGSGQGSHHAYPGGLATHEYFNASMSDAFEKNYDAHYFGGRPTVDRDRPLRYAGPPRRNRTFT